MRYNKAGITRRYPECKTLTLEVCHHSLAFLLLVTLILICSVPKAFGDTTPSLFSASKDKVSAFSIFNEPWSKKKKGVEVNSTALNNEFFNVSLGNATYEAHQEESSLAALNSGKAYLSSAGKLLSEGKAIGRFSLVNYNRAVIGSFNLDNGESYRLKMDSDGRYFVETLDHTKFPPCASPPADEHRRELLESFEINSDTEGVLNASILSIPTIDVMVLYTPLAAEKAGGEDGINALIALAVEESNQAYKNSQIDMQLRLVHTASVEDNSTGSFADDLTLLQGKDDGVNDEIHTLRDEYGADLVSLITANNDYCGMAYLVTPPHPDYAFSVVNAGCATGYYSFAHELAHNMGSHHDHDNAGAALYDFSYGHRFSTEEGDIYRTIMAYAPGTRIQYFSNPEVNFLGAPTGQDDAFNALSISKVAELISEFRAIKNEVDPGDDSEAPANTPTPTPVSTTTPNPFTTATPAPTQNPGSGGGSGGGEVSPTPTITPVVTNTPQIVPDRLEVSTTKEGRSFSVQVQALKGELIVANTEILVKIVKRNKKNRQRRVLKLTTDANGQVSISLRVRKRLRIILSAGAAKKRIILRKKR